MVISEAVGVRRPSRGRRFAVRNKLKLLLAFGDATAVTLGYFLGGWSTGYATRQGHLRMVEVMAFSVVAAFWALRSQGLYLSRVSAIRVVEITRAARAVVILGGVVLLCDRLTHYDWHVRDTIVASVACFVLLCIARSIYRTWLANAHERGLHCRRIRDRWHR